MNFDILTIFYFLAGFSFLIGLGITGTVINQLMGIRIQRPHLVIKDKSRLPEYLNKVFENGIKLLESLGFEYHHCQYTLDILCHQRNDKWSLVFINRNTNVFAEISPASSFLDLPGYEIDFWSIASDGTALITLNGRGHTILCGISKAEIHDPMAITLEEVYQSHLNERNDVFQNKPLLALSSENYIKIQQKLFDGYFLNLMNERGVVSTGKNEFKLTFTKAKRLLPQVLRGQKRLRKLLHEKLVWEDSQQNKSAPDRIKSVADNDFSVDAEVQSYLRMRSVQERTPGGLTAKLVLFALVLTLTYFAFDLHFSIFSFAIIISSFALHELGHLAAMMAFGYRNYQVLFFPVIVDTSNKETDIPAIWKQVVVYLMGPIPGIIIGLTLLALSQEYEVSWFYETAIILLVINYLNLLPIVPLDGGHLIRLTIMERFPSGKLILTGMAGIAFAAGGWHLGEPVYWLIALILFSTLPWSALEAGVLSELFQPTNDFEKLQRKERLKSLFETFRHQKFSKLQYLQKFNLIKGLSDTLLLPLQLGRLGTLGLNSVYLSALVLTPAVAIITVIGMDNTADMVAKIQGKAPQKNWSTLIDNADDPESKFKAILKAARFYTTTNNFDAAQAYLEQAEKTLALINQDDNQASLYDAYSFYYLNRKELDAAEEQQMKAIKLLEQSPRDNAFELTTSYQNLASIHDQQNSPNSLLDLKTALSYSLNTKLPEERYIITTAVNQILNKYYTVSDYNNAKSIILDTLSIISRHQDSPSKYVAGYLYQELAWLNILTSNLNESIKQFENSLTLSGDNAIKITDISSYGYDPFTRVNILLAMALVQNKAGNTNSSKAYLQQAEALLKNEYNETLSSYIESNLPELSNKEPGNQGNTQESNSLTSANPEVMRKNYRWQLIAQLIEDKNQHTETLELPKSASSEELATLPDEESKNTSIEASSSPMNNSEPSQQVILTTATNPIPDLPKTDTQTDTGKLVPSAGTAIENSTKNESSANVKSPDHKISQTNSDQNIEIPPLPGESTETKQTSSMNSQTLPSESDNSNKIDKLPAKPSTQQ